MPAVDNQPFFLHGTCRRTGGFRSEPVQLGLVNPNVLVASCLVRGESKADVIDVNYIDRAGRTGGHYQRAKY